MRRPIPWDRTFTVEARHVPDAGMSDQSVSPTRLTNNDMTPPVRRIHDKGNPKLQIFSIQEAAEGLEHRVRRLLREVVATRDVMA